MNHLTTLVFCLLVADGREVSIDGLVEQLKSADQSVRLRAARKMAKPEAKLPATAIVALEAALGDADAELRAVLIDALANAARESEEAVLALVRALEGPRNWTAGPALVRVGKVAVKTIARALVSGSTPRAHLALYHVLADMGPEAMEAIPALEKGLQAKDERLAAAEAIVAIDPKNKAVEGVLTSSLASKERGVRLIAAEALSRTVFFKTRETLATLVDITRDGTVDLNTYSRAVIAISRFGSAGKAALPLLTEHLRKWQAANPAWGAVVAGAIVKVDATNKEAREFLESQRDVLESLARPTSDRVFVNFARDLLDNILKKAS